MQKIMKRLLDTDMRVVESVSGLSQAESERRGMKGTTVECLEQGGWGWGDFWQSSLLFIFFRSTLVQ